LQTSLFTGILRPSTRLLLEINRLIYRNISQVRCQ